MKKEKRVFIIHGFEGHPNGGWRPWLLGELEKKEYYAAALVMKSPNTPKLSEWMEEIHLNVKKFPKDEIVLVGHSLGVPAILQYLQKYRPKNILHCVLVSGPYKDERKGKVSKILKSFFKKYDFKLLKKLVKKYSIIHGSNDPVVHFSHAEFLAGELQGKLVCVKNGMHLNGSAGFYTLKEAVNEIVC